VKDGRDPTKMIKDSEQTKAIKAAMDVPKVKEADPFYKVTKDIVAEIEKGGGKVHQSLKDRLQDDPEALKKLQDHKEASLALVKYDENTGETSSNPLLKLHEDYAKSYGQMLTNTAVEFYQQQQQQE
jgi:hypothetical protein